MGWSEAHRRATEAADRAEGVLNSTAEIEWQEKMVDELQKEIEQVKKEAKTEDTSQIEAYRELEQRKNACRRRLGIIRMSMMQKEAGEEPHTRRAEPDYYDRNNSKLQEYVKIASHSVHAIEKQKKLLQNSRKQLEEMLGYLGFSDRVVEQISHRYLTDYRIFKSLAALFVILFIYVFFIKKSK